MNRTCLILTCRCLRDSVTALICVVALPILAIAKGATVRVGAASVMAGEASVAAPAIARVRIDLIFILCLHSAGCARAFRELRFQPTSFKSTFPFVESAVPGGHYLSMWFRRLM